MKKYIFSKIPKADYIKSHKHLQFLGDHLEIANLWHFNRKSVAGGVAIGLFCAWVPIPFQMVLAAILAIIFSVNMPIPIALVWITNPVTMPVFFYFAYWFGAKILNTPLKDIEFQLSFAWLAEIFGQIWQPFLLGCLIIGVSSSLVGYFLVKWIWHFQIIKRWKQRKKRDQSEL